MAKPKVVETPPDEPRGIVISDHELDYIYAALLHYNLNNINITPMYTIIDNVLRKFEEYKHG